MWMLAIPVVIIEDLPLLAGLRRNWRMIHGHGSALAETLAKAYGVWFLLMLIPIFVISTPSLPVVLHWFSPTAIAELGYCPFMAIALTLTYCRLAAICSAAEPDSDSRPEPAPAAQQRLPPVAFAHGIASQLGGERAVPGRDRAPAGERGRAAAPDRQLG